MRPKGFFVVAAASLLLVTSACHGGPSTALPTSDTTAQSESSGIVSTSETLYVGSEGTQIIPQPPGIAPIIIDAGPVFQIFNTSTGTQQDVTPPYVGLTAFGVSADRSQLIAGGEANGFQGSFNDGVEAYSLTLNHEIGTFFDNGSQVQTASAFSGDNSKIYFADGNHTAYGYNLVTKTPLGPFSVPNYGGYPTSINSQTGVAVNFNGSVFYVVNNTSLSGPSTIEVYNAVTKTISTKIVLPTPSLVLRADWAGGRIYAASYNLAKIFIINASTNQMQGYVYESGGRASVFELNHTGTRLYAASGRHITVYAMDTPCKCGVADAHFTVPYAVQDLKLDLAGTHLFVAQNGTLTNGQPAPALELNAATGATLRSFPAPLNTANKYTTAIVAIDVR